MPPLKWHGGKTYLAKRHIALMTKHTHYGETHFGGGAVLFQKNPHEIDEAINDINGELINFWRVLKNKDTFEEFKRQISVTPFSLNEWEKAVEYYKRGDEISRAISFFVRYRQSRQGLGKVFATPVKNRIRRGMNENISAWLSSIDDLEEARNRLIRVEICNLDANEFIKYRDHDNHQFYIDPPYLIETRIATDVYEYEMTYAQHKQLLETLTKVDGPFILCGYNNKLYEDFRRLQNWRRLDIEIDNKASSKEDKPMKVESVWLNY